MREYNIDKADRDKTIIQAIHVHPARSGEAAWLDIMFDDRIYMPKTSLTMTLDFAGYLNHIAGGLSGLVEQERGKQGEDAVVFSSRNAYYDVPEATGTGLVIGGVDPEAVVNALGNLPEFKGKVVIDSAMKERILQGLEEDKIPKPAMQPITSDHLDGAHKGGPFKVGYDLGFHGKG